MEKAKAMEGNGFTAGFSWEPRYLEIMDFPYFRHYDRSGQEKKLTHTVMGKPHV